jgi:non-heme chloroperoxidase
VVDNREEFSREFGNWVFDAPSPDKLRFLGRIGSQTPTAIAATLSATYLFVDNRAELASLEGRVPLLYYMRREAEQQAASWAKRYTPSAVVAASGGHMMFWEDPDPFNAALDEFLSSILKA